METNQRQRKLDLVWANVFLVAFAMWGLTVLAIAGAPGMGMVILVIVMACGAFFGLVAVSILLVYAEAGRVLLAVGRVLLFLQLCCQALVFLMIPLAITGGWA